MSRLLFNLLSGLLAALVLSGAAGVVSTFFLYPGSLAVKSMPNAEWLLWVGLWVTVYSPLWVFITPVFAFLGVDTEGVAKVGFVPPLVGALILVTGLSTLAIHVGAEGFLSALRDRELEDERSLLAERIKEATDLTSLESRWQRNPAEGPAVIRELEQKAFAFPFQFDVATLLDKVRRSEQERLWQKSEPGRDLALTGTETRAVEARNRRDFATAAILYRQCLSRTPDTRPFAVERARLEASLETVLELERNPGSTLTDAELRNRRLRERLGDIDARLAKGDPFTAFPLARDLRLEFPRHPEVQLRYERSEKELRGDEFLLQDALLVKTMLPETPSLSPVRFSIDGGTLSADRMQWGPGGVYLDRPRWVRGNDFLSFAWGRITGDRLQMKNADFEKSRVLILQGLHGLQEQAMATSEGLRARQAFRAPFAMERLRAFVAGNLGGDDFVLRFLRELRFFLPGLLMAAGLLLCGMAWWNREHLVDPFYILAVLWALIFTVVIYGAVVYTAAVHEAHTSLAAMRSVIGAILAAYGLSAATFFARGR